MFKKDRKKEETSLLEEVDDMYLSESAGISKAGSAVVANAYVQADMLAAFNSRYSHNTNTNSNIYTRRKLF